MGCELIKLGESTVILCGRKTHECNEDLNVLLLSDGERVENTPENWEKYQDKITGGSVGCSICGRLAIDNAMWL